MPAVPMPTGRDPVQTARDEQMRIMQQGGGYTPLNLNVMNNTYSNPDPVPLSEEQQLALMQMIQQRNMAAADDQAGYIQNLLAMTPVGGGGGLNSLLNPDLQMLRLQMEAGRPQQLQAPQQIRNWADGLNMGVANFANALNNRMYQKQMMGAIQGYRDDQMAQQQAMQEAMQQRALLEQAQKQALQNQLIARGIDPLLAGNQTALNAVLGESGKRQLGLQFTPQENAQKLQMEQLQAQQKFLQKKRELLSVIPKDEKGNATPEGTQAYYSAMMGVPVSSVLDTAGQTLDLQGKSLSNQGQVLQNQIAGIGLPVKQLEAQNTLGGLQIGQDALARWRAGATGEQTAQDLLLSRMFMGGDVPGVFYGTGKVDPNSPYARMTENEQRRADEIKRQNTPQTPGFMDALGTNLGNIPKSQFGQHVGGAFGALGRTLYNPQSSSWTDRGIGALGGLIKNNVIPYFTQPVGQ